MLTRLNDEYEFYFEWPKNNMNHFTVGKSTRRQTTNQINGEMIY